MRRLSAILILSTLIFIASASTAYPGIRIDVSAPFLKTTTKMLLPKLIYMAQNMLPQYIEMKAFGEWPLFFHMNVTNLTSVYLKLPNDSATIESVPRNSAFFIKIPITNWTISFKYAYLDTRNGLRYNGNGTLKIINFNFQTEFAIVTSDSGMSPEILALNLDLGTTSLTFSDSSGWLWYFSEIVNNWKWVYLFPINYLARDLINLFMRFSPMALPIEIAGGYALDLSLAKQFLMNAANIAILPRAEIYNSKKGLRGDVSAPKDLIGFPAPTTTLRLLLNSHIFNTAFASMLKSGDLTIVLHDEEVYRYTQFLHLRTSDFQYYIPGLLKENGDVAMDLKITPEGKLPSIDFSSGSLTLAGSFRFDFIVKGKSNIQLVMDMGLSLAAALTDMKAKAKLNWIVIAKLAAQNCNMVDKNNCPTNSENLRREFNILFKYIVNAANIYAFDQEFAIPTEIPLPIDNLKLKIRNGALKIDNQALSVETNLAIEK